MLSHQYVWGDILLFKFHFKRGHDEYLFICFGTCVCLGIFVNCLIRIWYYCLYYLSFGFWVLTPCWISQILWIFIPFDVFLLAVQSFIIFSKDSSKIDVKNITSMFYCMCFITLDFIFVLHKILLFLCMLI